MHKTDPEPEPISVAGVKKRLEEIMSRRDTYRNKSFKKVPASAVIKDLDFLLFVITVMSSANAELKEQSAEKSGGLVGINGKALSATKEPLITLVTS